MVFLGWKARGMKAWKPPVSSCAVAQSDQMVDTLGQGLPVPVEHGGVRADAKAMRQLVHLDPLLARDLAAAHQVAHPLRQDLGSPAGECAQTDRLQVEQHLLLGHAALAREVHDLAGREGGDVQFGVAAVDGGDHVADGPVAERRVLAPHDVQLGRAEVPGLLGADQHLVEAHGVGAVFALVTREGAKVAAVLAHVGVIDVAVVDEVDLLAAAGPARTVGHPPETQQLGRFEQGQAVVGRQALARPDLLFDGVQRLGGRADRHGREVLPSHGWSLPRPRARGTPADIRSLA